MHAILGWVWQLLVNENANGEIEKRLMEIVFRRFIKSNFNSPTFYASVYFHFHSRDNEDFFFLFLWNLLRLNDHTADPFYLGYVCRQITVS